MHIISTVIDDRYYISTPVGCRCGAVYILDIVGSMVVAGGFIVTVVVGCPMVVVGGFMLGPMVVTGGFMVVVGVTSQSSIVAKVAKVGKYCVISCTFGVFAAYQL